MEIIINSGIIENLSNFTSHYTYTINRITYDNEEYSLSIREGNSDMAYIIDDIDKISNYKPVEIEGYTLNKLVYICKKIKHQPLKIQFENGSAHIKGLEL